MNILSRLSFRARVTAACYLCALIPLGVVMAVVWHAASKMATAEAEQYQTVEANIGDKIDRNLFERYGDVQAFTNNQVVRDQEAWGQVGESNPIVSAMNKYVDLYDVYYLTLLVDTNGKLLAVNSKD